MLGWCLRGQLSAVSWRALPPSPPSSTLHAHVSHPTSMWHTYCLIRTGFLKPPARAAVVWIQGRSSGLAESFAINTLEMMASKNCSDRSGPCGTVGLSDKGVALCPQKTYGQQVRKELMCEKGKWVAWAKNEENTFRKKVKALSL